MTSDAVTHFGREITFEVIGQFLPDVLAIDFYNHGVDLHGKVQVIGKLQYRQCADICTRVPKVRCPSWIKVTRGFPRIPKARCPAETTNNWDFETFLKVLNPTAM